MNWSCLFHFCQLSSVLFDETVTRTEVTVTPLPPGSRTTLGVTALTADNTLEGRRVTAVTYTGNAGNFSCHVG